MRAYVFTDTTLERQAGRFVWLAMNTERAQNAPLRRQFPVAALPTYLIVDPADEKVALRWVGAATVPQLHQLLNNGVTAVQRRHGASGVDAQLALADSLYGAQSDSAAVVAYRKVLFLLPLDSTERPRIVESLCFALQRVGDPPAVARLAQNELPRYRHTNTGANLAASGLDAAVSLPAENPDRARLVTEFETETRAVLADPAVRIAADDRSGLYISLAEARRDAGDSTGAQQVAAEWAGFLEQAAAAAVTPEQRTVFDSHRVTAYLALGQPERAIPMLEASERDLPDDYNPPARLAVVYRAMKRWPDALAASDRALAKAYGPRQLGILQTRADIYIGMGDNAAARRTLEQAVATAEALPAGQRSESTIAALRKKLEAIQ